jgi:hypothetical protein
MALGTSMVNGAGVDGDSEQEYGGSGGSIRRGKKAIVPPNFSIHARALGLHTCFWGF